MIIKGLIFDKDGTLFDFRKTWESWAHSLFMRLAKHDETRAIALGQSVDFDVANRRFDPQSVVIAGTPEDIVLTLLPQLPGYTQEALTLVLNEEAATAPQQQAVPLGPLLAGFKNRGLAIGVATNDSETPARAHLKQAGVHDAFDFIAGYDSGFGGKPAPGQLLGFCSALALDPTQVAMVGDSTHDLHAGKAAGMKTIAVLTGLASESDLAPWADVVLPDIGYIPGWLDGYSHPAPV